MFNLQKAYNKEGEVSGWMKLCIYLYIFWPPVLEGERETRKFSVPVFDRKKKRDSDLKAMVPQNPQPRLTGR